MRNQIERLRRYKKVLKRDFTRSQANQTTIYEKKLIRNLFPQRISQSLRPNSTPREITKNILLYSASTDMKLYNVLEKMLDQVENRDSPHVKLTHGDIEVLYKKLPSLDFICKRLAEEAKINDYWGREDKGDNLRHDIENIRTLQQNLDSFCQEILFPPPKKKLTQQEETPESANRRNLRERKERGLTASTALRPGFLRGR